MGIFIILILYVLQAFLDKSASKFTTDVGTAVGYGILKSASSAVIALIVAFSFRISAVGFAIALLAGVSQAICTVFILLALKKYSIVQVNLFMTASMLIPTICGYLIFSEKFTVVKFVFILAIIFASVMILGITDINEIKIGGKNFILLLVVWTFYGLIMLAQKMFAIYVPKGNVSVFSFYMYFISFISLSIYGVYSRKCYKVSFPKNKLLIICICTSLVVFLMNQILTSLSSTVPSYLLFPITNGGKLVMVLLVSALVFKEKPTFKMLIGCVIMLAAALFLNIN